MVSDSGPQFCSEEFQSFLRSNGVKHIRTASYHPATNGASKRMVLTVKQALRAGLYRGAVMEKCLASFLIQYRNTLHATTGVSLSQLLAGRSLQIRFNLLRSSAISSYVQQQQRQKSAHDQSSHNRALSAGQCV